jgi:hypothetical protein
MKNTIMMIISFLFLLTACDNAVNQNLDSPADTYTITYSAAGPDVSQLLGWQWAKEDSDFTWIFKNDGTVSVIHCCGDTEDNQFGYLLRGNVLITYGNEEGAAMIEATNFTMADNGVFFTRDNGTKFIRGEEDNGSSPDSPVVLSNDLLGTWQEEDGTEYEFSSDTGLRINSQQSGYFALYNELLTLGPLVDGETADVQYYTFNRIGNKLYLRHSAKQKHILSLLE